MDDQATLLTVLQNAIGLRTARQRQAIVNFGFDTCNGLKNTSEADFRGLFSTIERNNRNLPERNQVRLNLTAKAHLDVIREEFIMRSECAAEMGLAMLIQMTMVQVDQFVAKHRAWKIAKEASQGASLPSIDVPKLTKKNWKEFYRALVETLGRQKGVSSVPLLYVVRGTAVGNYELPYASTEKQLTACLTHAGENYNTDREAVYSLLVEHSKDSEIASIIERYANTRNGRAAWTAMLAHMQSTSYMDTLKTQAMHKIKNAHYDGEKRDFGIARYYTIHTTAHNDLAEAGEPMTDGMKITNFCNGIKDATAVNYAITTKSDPAANQTFEAFYNSFSAKLTSHLTLIAASSGSSRSISAVSQHRGRGRGGRGRGSHGRGRYTPYRGRGRGRGRGGRGRGGYRSTSTSWTPKAREYSSEEWNDLSYWQQQRVRDLRRALNSHNDGEDGSNSNRTDNHNINATETVENGSIPGEVSLGGGSVASQSGRAGDAFAPRGSTGSNSRQRGAGQSH